MRPRTVGSRNALYMLPEVDEHLVEKKFGEFKVNPPEVGEVESQFYVPPNKMTTPGQWARSRFASFT
jgi:hypothetical protein